VIDAKTFAFIGNYSGYYRIKIWDLNNNNISVLTDSNNIKNGNYDVLQIVGYEPNNRTLFYLSTEGSSLDSNLYAINILRILNLQSLL